MQTGSPKENGSPNEGEFAWICFAVDRISLFFRKFKYAHGKKRNVQYFWWSFQKNAEDFCIILQRGREMMRAKRALQCEMYTKKYKQKLRGLPKNRAESARGSAAF